MERISQSLSVLLLTAALGFATGCEDKNKSAAPAKPTGTSSGAAKPDSHDHADGDKHDHDHDDHGHGEAAELGTATIGGFTVKATQEGSVEEGKDAAFELAISGGTGKPSAVRAWIGTEDAKGSTKGKAEVEGDGYHLHVEVPKPIPAAAKLWIEIENAEGKRSVGSLSLKQ